MIPVQNSETIPLAEGRSGDNVRVAKIHGGNQMVRRMLALGIRVGTEVEILYHRGEGIVVGNAGARVALGADIADKLLVETLSH